MGAPLGDPGDSVLQRSILTTALAMLENPSIEPGAIELYHPAL
jgi:hypothetical protein